MAAEQKRREGALRDQVVSSVSWRSAETFVNILFQIGTIILLSRLLLPEEVGLVAAGMGIIYLLMVFAELGSGPALVQRQDLKRQHIGAAFWIVILASCALIAALHLLAGQIATLLGLPQLKDVLPVLAPIILLHSLASVFEALASRELNFRLIALTNFWAVTLGYCLLSVLSALAGLGLWALVIGYLGRSALQLLIYAALLTRQFSAVLSRRALAEVLSFGSVLAVGRIAGQASMSVDRTIVGGLLGAEMAGFYARSRQLLTIFWTAAMGPLTTVLFPVMSRVQGDAEKLDRAFRSCLNVSGLFFLPAAAIIALAADPILPLVLGAQWSGVVPPLQILTINLVFMALIGPVTALAQAVGKLRAKTVMQTVSAGLTLLAIFLLHPWGLEWVCVGIAGALMLHAVLSVWLAASILRRDRSALTAPLLPGVLVAASLTLVYLAAAALLGGLGAAVLAEPAALLLVIITFFSLLLFLPALLRTQELRDIRLAALRRFAPVLVRPEQ